MDTVNQDINIRIEEKKNLKKYIWLILLIQKNVQKCNLSHIMVQYIILADHVQMLFSTDNLSVLYSKLQNVTIPNVARLYHSGRTTQHRVLT